MSLVTGFPSKTLRTAKASTDEAGSGGKLVPCVGIPAFIVRDRSKKKWCQWWTEVVCVANE